MAVGDVEAWGIFANVVAAPLSTIIAAVISSLGTVAAVSMITDSMKQAVAQQRTLETELIARLPKTKFF